MVAMQLTIQLTMQQLTMNITFFEPSLSIEMEASIDDARDDENTECDFGHEEETDDSESSEIDFEMNEVRGLLNGLNQNYY